MMGFEADRGSLFDKGNKVEIRSDEEGFEGAWYRGSILLESSPKSVHKRRSKVLVEYETLVMEDGSGPLVENVDTADIRPLPPEEDSSCQDFEVNDIVDANYRDGWWVGTVRKVLGGSRYRVYFDSPPDVMDFDVRHLRFHWDWNFGHWARPAKEQMKESIFSSGAAVEVKPDSSSLCDVWIPAIVVKDYGGKNFLVKYSSEIVEYGDSVKINVDLLHIRAIPPPYPDRCYELLEKVEASYGIGWRSGIVTKRLADGKYNILFKQGNEDKELSLSEIRPHLEWIDGEWIGASKEIFLTSDCQEQSCDALNHLESIGASDNSEAVLIESPCASIKSVVDVQLEMTDAFKHQTEDKTPPSTSTENKLMKRPAAGSENSPSCFLRASEKRFKIAARNHCYMDSQPHKDPMQEDDEELPLSRALKLKKGPLEMLTKETTRGLAAQKNDGSVKRFSRSPAVVNWDFSQLASPFPGTNIKAKNQNVDELGCLDVYSAIRKKRSVKSRTHITRVSEAGMRNSTINVAFLDMKEDGAKVDDAGVPFILALKAKGIRDSQAENSSQLPNEKPLKAVMDLNEKTNNLPGDKSVKSGSRGSQRRRGRPRKLTVIEPNLKEADGVQHRAGHATGETAEDCIFSEAIMPALQQPDSTDSPGLFVLGTVEVSQEDCMGKEVDMAITLVSDDIADADQPLSSWFGGNHSSTSFEELRLSSGGIVNGAREKGGGQIDVATESSPLATVDGSVANRIACSPFVKGSSIWQTIESMEVFQILPQDPHFYPLAECKEGFREGYAIGLMVTFSSLFEKISKLHIDHPSSMFDSALETLDDLEKCGFDVWSLKENVRQLLLIKDAHMQLLNDSKDFEGELMVHIQELTRLDEETREIERKMSDVQKQLETIKLKKEVKDDKIINLRSEVEAVNSSIQNVRTDFQKQCDAGPIILAQEEINQQAEHSMQHIQQGAQQENFGEQAQTESLEISEGSKAPVGRPERVKRVPCWMAEFVS